jgi:two-component system sensor histidine kinase BaeS
MRSLLSKLTLALMATALLSLITMIVITRINFRSGFIEFLQQQETMQLNNLAPVMAEIYQRNGSWAPLAANERLWNRMLNLGRAEEGPGRGFRPQSRRHDAVRQIQDGMPRDAGRWRFRDRLFLLDHERRRVAGVETPDPEATMVPIEAAGETVGWIGVESLGRFLPPEAGVFLSEQRRSAILSLVAAAVLAALLAFLLARHFSRPISRLAGTVKLLNKGDYAARSGVASADEIGQLAVDVNSLATTLESAEQSRRRWMAEIAHELRTPIAILKGELEALKDGVRSHDADSLGSLAEEVDHLAGLIDDLQMLALSDSGALRFDLQDVELSNLVQTEAAHFRPRFDRADINMVLRLEDRVVIRGDQMRLRQLIRNLLENSLRYTDPGGQLELGLSTDSQTAVVWIDDSAPGVTAEQLSRLFERLYRVEESRNRAGGGSGLGLAICSRIVEAHGGTISARNSRFGGLSIRISLPLSDATIPALR